MAALAELCSWLSAPGNTLATRTLTLTLILTLTLTLPLTLTLALPLAPTPTLTLTLTRARTLTLTSTPNQGNKLERLDMRDAMPGADATDSPAALAQSEAAVSMLCAALASPHCVLEELNVHGFGFTAESVPRLAEPLLRPGCALRKLHLARWPIPLTSLVDESGGLSFGGAAGCVEDMVLVCALLEHGRGGALPLPLAPTPAPTPTLTRTLTLPPFLTLILTLPLPLPLTRRGAHARPLGGRRQPRPRRRRRAVRLHRAPPPGRPHACLAQGARARVRDGLG